MKRLAALALAVVPLATLLVRAQPPGCGGADGVEITWDGGNDRDVRMRFAIDGGTPIVRELAIRKRGGAWRALASNVRPEFRIVSGLRRMSNQQMQPLRELGVELTPEIVNEKKWDAFWDAPLDLKPPPPGRGGGAEFSGNPPPARGVAGQPGLPRAAEEIQRATATYTASPTQRSANAKPIPKQYRSGETLPLISGPRATRSLECSPSARRSVVCRM